MYAFSSFSGFLIVSGCLIWLYKRTYVCNIWPCKIGISNSLYPYMPAGAIDITLKDCLKHPEGLILKVYILN